MQELRLVSLSDVKVSYGIHHLPMSNIGRFHSMAKREVLAPYANNINVMEKDDHYILLSNRLGYEIACLSGQADILVNIIDIDSREDYINMKNIHETPLIPLKTIRLCKEFRGSRVGKEKLKRAENYYKTYGVFDKAITVRLEERLHGRKTVIVPILVDGLSRYVVAKRLGLKDIECIVENGNEEI